MTKIWVIIPSAGSGKRFESTLPKQYHSLLDSTVLEQTIKCFAERSDVAGVVLCIAEGDYHAEHLQNEKVFITLGGKERSDSVNNGLLFLQDKIDVGDLVAVHDAARPCVRQCDLDAVFQAAQTSEDGALLAIPSFNTLKQLNNNKVVTLDRRNVYQALTPQVFAYGLLERALAYVADNSLAVTDDASAVEQLGLSPTIVLGHSDNIKITEPADLALAEFYKKQQSSQLGGAS